MTRAFINTDLGREILCAKCGEYWPDDAEFFYQSKGRSHSWCKACYRADEKVIAKNQRWLDQRKNKTIIAEAPEHTNSITELRVVRPEKPHHQSIA